jgi:hypothetical protein
MKVVGEILHLTDVSLDRCLSVVSTLEFFEHHLA